MIVNTIIALMKGILLLALWDLKRDNMNKVHIWAQQWYILSILSNEDTIKCLSNSHVSSIQINGMSGSPSPNLRADSSLNM